MKIKLRLLCMLLFISHQTIMLADLIVANQYVRYLTDFHGKDVYIVTDDAPNFRCNNINRILINGKLTYADNYVSGQDIYDITHLAEGINFISTNNTYDENEYAYLIYKCTCTDASFLTNKDYVIGILNDDVSYWEKSNNNGVSWEKIDCTNLYYTDNVSEEGTIMYRNISTNGLYSDILTIKYVDPVPENIKTNIDGTSKIVDDAATLTLDIKDNNYKYQWLLNGETIAGATSNTYHIENVKMKDAGSYTCRVRNECTETVSTPVTLTVSKCQQTIDFPEFETVTYGCEPITLPRTTNKNLPLTYTSTNTSVATISGNVVTVLAPGETNIIASQSGNDDYIEVTVTRTLTVNKIEQSITFDALPEKTYGDAPFKLEGTSSAELPVSYKSTDTNVATVAGNTVTIVGAGTTEIIASQEGNSTHYSATPVSQKLIVNKAPQTITFNAIRELEYEDQTIIRKKTDKGLTITYTVKDESIAAVKELPSDLDYFYIEALKPGTTTITATQEGDDNHLPAESVEQTVTVVKGSQSINLSQISSRPYGTSDFSLIEKTNKGLTITYKSDNEAVATVDRNIVHIIGAGTCNITATQEGNEYYKAAEPVTVPFTVTKAEQTITFNKLGEYAYGIGTITLTASSTSGLDIYFESSDENVARIEDNKAVITGAGECYITARTVSSPNYYDTSAKQKLVITKAGQSIDIDDLTEKTYGDAPFELSASTSSDRQVTFSSSNSNILLITGTTARILGAGDVVITATIKGDENYETTSVRKELHINKASLTVKADNKTKLYGDEIPELTITYIGFVNDDTEYDLDNKGWASTLASKYSSVGTYSISPTNVRDKNYEINYQDGTLIVEKAPLTITPDDVVKTYGDDNPSLLTYTCTGLKLNETEDEALSLKPTVITDAKLSSPAGSYPIIATGASAKNYEIAYEQGTLTVEKAVLDIWLENETVAYGNEPEYKLYFNGWKLGDGEADLDILPNVVTLANVKSYPGSYVISLEGGLDNNYSYNLLKYTRYLNIEKAVLDVTVLDATKAYGQPNPAFVLEYEGFKNNDTENDLERRPTVTCDADENTWYGEYPIRLSGGYDSRYTFNLHDGVLTILPEGTSITETEVEGLSIRCENGSIVITSESGVNAVEVYDIGGQLVASEKDVNGSELRFDVGRQGVYIIRLWTDNGAMARKVLLK